MNDLNERRISCVFSASVILMSDLNEAQNSKFETYQGRNFQTIIENRSQEGVATQTYTCTHISEATHTHTHTHTN